MENETFQTADFLAAILGDVYDTGCENPGIVAVGLVEELARALGQPLQDVGDIPWGAYRKVVVGEIALTEALMAVSMESWSFCDDLGCETDCQCPVDGMPDENYVDFLIYDIFEHLTDWDLKAAVNAWYDQTTQATRPGWLNDETRDVLVVAIQEAWVELDCLPAPT